MHTTGSPLSQPNPLDSLGRPYPDDRSTASLEGFLRDGRKQLSCIIESNKITGREFQWFITINHEDILSIKEINAQWKTFTNRTRRYYDQGLAFFWVREPTPSDTRRLHYHLAILDGFCGDIGAMEDILRTCLSRFSRYHLSIKPAWPRHVATYMLKLGEKHRDHILLFKPGLKLRRHGLAGHFLPKGMKKRSLEKRVNKREKEIAEGASMLGHPELVQHISRFLQLPLKQVRRLVGEDPYNPVWESWMDSMRRSSRY
jgi:hypothetical protein